MLKLQPECKTKALCPSSFSVLQPSLDSGYWRSCSVDTSAFYSHSLSVEMSKQPWKRMFECKHLRCKICNHCKNKTIHQLSSTTYHLTPRTAHQFIVCVCVVGETYFLISFWCRINFIGVIIVSHFGVAAVSVPSVCDVRKSSSSALQAARKQVYSVLYLCMSLCQCSCLNGIRSISTCLDKSEPYSVLLFWGPEQTIRVHAGPTRCQVFIETSLATDGAGDT